MTSHYPDAWSEECLELMKRNLTQTAHPLAPMQQGMLFRALSAPHTGVDVEQVLLVLSEKVDLAALERAWKRVVDHHEVLRTNIKWHGASAVQEIQPEVHVPFRSEDWRSLAAEEKENAFATWLNSDRLCDLNLSHGPLMRITVFRTEELEWKLIWTFHHLLLDAQGITIVLKDVFAYYEAFKRGGELSLPVSPAYQEHIQYLQRLDQSQAEEFWRKALEGYCSSPTPF